MDNDFAVFIAKKLEAIIGEQVEAFSRFLNDPKYITFEAEICIKLE